MVTIVVVSLILAVTPTVMTSDIDVTFLHSCHNPDDDHEDKDEMAFQMKHVDLFFNDNIGNLALGQQ